MKTCSLKGIGDPKPERGQNKKTFTQKSIKPLFAHVGNASIESKVFRASDLPEKVDRALKPIKTPKENIAKLKAKLDKVFSLYIRKRFADKDGNVFCFTSGKRYHWKEVHCGHFISRRHLGTRWDEINCQVQSIAENLYNQGNAPEFAKRIEEKYGKQALDLLHIKKNNKVKMGAFEYQCLITEYENKLKELK